MYSEGGNTELDWCKRVFESSDMAKHISWRKIPEERAILSCPPDPESARGRRLPSGGFTKAGKKMYRSRIRCRRITWVNYGDGLQTPSGKYEFIPETLTRIDDPGGRRLNKYMPEPTKTRRKKRNWRSIRCSC